MADLELRHATRYPLAAPVTFRWPTSQGWVRAGQGTTRDISSDGVMVAAGACPPVGVHIQLTVFLPRREASGHAVKLHGEGIVVRVQSCESMPLSERTSGFAASVQFAVAPFVWTGFSVFKWKDCSANRRRGGGNVKIGFIDFQGLVGRAENSSIVFRAFHETGISTALHPFRDVLVARFQRIAREVIPESSVTVIRDPTSQE